MYEPTPRLFAGGNPRDRRTGGRRTGGRGGAVAAVVVLALLGGAASFYAVLVFPFAGDNCDPSDHSLICTPTGLRIVAAGPLYAAALGVAVAACALAPRVRLRALLITAGYAIALGGFLTALAIASPG